MKKFFFTIFVLSLALFSLQGCVVKRQQSVTGQVFTSTSNPTMTVAVKENLEFIGSANSKATKSQPDFADTVDHEVFVFGASDYDLIKKALIFHTETLNDHNARFLQKGCQMLNGENYFFNDYIYENMTKKCRLVGITNDNIINTHLGFNTIEEQDKYFSGAYLFEFISTVVNGSRSDFKKIYLERIEINANTPWEARDGDLLSDEEKELYEAFLNNAKTAYTPVSKKKTASPSR